MPQVTILNPPMDMEYTVLEADLNEEGTTITSQDLRNLGTIRSLIIGEKRISLTAFTYTTVNQQGIFDFTDGSTIKPGSLLFISYRQ